jgi:hypothetical protein
MSNEKLIFSIEPKQKKIQRIEQESLSAIPLPRGETCVESDWKNFLT